MGAIVAESFVFSAGSSESSMACLIPGSAVDAKRLCPSRSRLKRTVGRKPKMIDTARLRKSNQARAGGLIFVTE
jgi:hypothetical protein